LQTVLGHETSRRKGFEIPDALRLFERLDPKGKIVTGDAIFCQKSISAKIVEGGGESAVGRDAKSTGVALRDGSMLLNRMVQFA
jgi:predicted transposase YbfD/YdcC